MYKELREFGLADNEATLYIALLKIGQTTANRLAKLTGMKRSTTYDNLNLLINKGIVSNFTTDNVQLFEAADPQKLVHILDDKKKKIQQLVPQLQQLKETISEKSGVTFYEGKRGVLTVLNDIIDKRKELWFYGSRKRALIAFQHYPDNFIQKRAEHKIRLKAVLAEEDKTDKVYKDEHISKLSDLRFLKNFNRISTNTFIYGENVAFMTAEENPVGVIIRNKKIVEQQQKIFMMFWKLAKK